MTVETWWVWMILAAVFVIGEIFTAGFFLLWFGIGAAAAGLLALLGIGAGWQWVAFIVVSGVLFAVSRRFAERLTQEQPSGVGADRLIGKKGIVLEVIDNIKASGRVRVGQEEWRARGETDDTIPVDARVEVVRVDGTHVVVRLFKEEE